MARPGYAALYPDNHRSGKTRYARISRECKRDVSFKQQTANPFSTLYSIPLGLLH